VLPPPCHCLLAVRVTLDTMLGAITKFGGPEVGAVSAGVQGLMDTSFSLWTAWDSVINPQQSIKNSLHNDLVKLEDYLVCEVQGIVGAAQNAIVQDMSQVRQRGAAGLLYTYKHTV
jgi:hypothetical protein